MDLLILNEQFELVHIMDTYESFIWTDRYYANGDFELHTSMRDDYNNYLKRGYYIQNRHSNRTMIIEKIVIKSDIEDGDTITVTGRSLESLLSRRIVWGQKMINGNLQNGIKELINESIINPTDEKRKINTFEFHDSTDESITELTMDAQYMGDNLYEAIQKVCQEKDIGFQIILKEDKRLIFSLYRGLNRSYDQLTNPYVIFSPTFENIIEGNYLESNMETKNVLLVGGEGEGSAKKYATVGDVSGIDRRESFINASDLSTDVGNHKVLTPTEYAAVLTQRGNEQLTQLADVKSFDGKIENDLMYIYGVDFFIGDTVQIANRYGHEGKVIVIETIISTDTSGVQVVYPTYKTVT